jgi:glutamyl-tRNA synthetase
MTRTRFAPSPTGFLHIGNARTALFNWAYARRTGGSLVLRIEDTDRDRSTREFETALLEALRWLGIDWDEGPLRQSEHHARHTEAVRQLVERGRAYRCVCTREELEARKAATIAAGDKWTYDGRCRDAAHGPDCGPHTVRLRTQRRIRVVFTAVEHKRFYLGNFHSSLKIRRRLSSPVLCHHPPGKMR